MEKTLVERAAVERQRASVRNSPPPPITQEKHPKFLRFF